MSLAGHDASTARDAWRELGVGSRPCRVGRGQGRGSWRLRRSRRRGAGAARMPAGDRPGPGTDGDRSRAGPVELAGRPAVGSSLSDPGWCGVCPGLPDRTGPGGAPGWWRRPRTGGAVEVLVVISLGTVLPEELAFRGLLLALLGRRYGVLAGILLSSGLFGLWHVVPSLGGGTTNAPIASVVGADAAGMVARVVVTVGFTSLAGALLCWLRLRSGSLLAPILAHWTVNGLGVIVTLVA